MSNDWTIHEKGLCESTRVGSGTRIWAFAHVLPGASIGADCNICDGVFVENDVVLGDRVTRTSFSFGTGIHWRQIWFDLAFSYSTQEQKESGVNTLGSYETTRKINRPSGMLNFTGFF